MKMILFMIMSINKFNKEILSKIKVKDLELQDLNFLQDQLVEELNLLNHFLLNFQNILNLLMMNHLLSHCLIGNL